MKPLYIDVIFPMPEGWGICLSCEMLMAHGNVDQSPHRRGLDEYPPDWQEDLQRLSDMVLNLSSQYQEKVMILIWDPRSLQGLWKCIRYGVRRYPAFIVGGQVKITGWDAARLEQVVQAAVAAVAA